jgi:NADH:ubiquinone oxidoreductase subunit 6 (subunit J)
MTFFFWMVSIVLIVAGIYFLLQRQWIYAAVCILVGALIGPIGVSLIK